MAHFARGPGWCCRDHGFGGSATRRRDVLTRLIAKIDRIENFVKSQRGGGAAAILTSANRTRKGLAGFRAGSHPDPHVGFDGRSSARRFPSAPAAPRRWAMGTRIIRGVPEESRPLSTTGRRHSRQHASNTVRPRWWNDAGAASGGVDVSAFGFAVSDSEDSDGEGMDMEAPTFWKDQKTSRRCLVDVF
ncbi:hypothetical protein CYMTET_16407 [Cymbomonas tetramitiformis]|uniref:Uncharacterized protein n=1 Tax=Cymbomonas tetramitiformis TaxID=36881 RepID=A0AAE0L8A6_9CHLO|nr:hypothetical protein CYMTET_16407 [Cymbomonas tetramitiformis]